MKKILLLLIFMICGFSWGQIAIPGTAAVTQNFTIGISATASLPTHWKMSVAGASAPTWADTGNFTATTAEASTGSPTAGGRYNWGNGTTISDRAIGFMTSGSYANPNSIMAHYQNTSGVQINDLVIAFDYERYRINTAACSITFFTSTDGFSWTARTAGDSGAFATGVSAYNYTIGTIVNRSFTLTGINIANNGNLYLRWNFNTTGGNSQGVGLDNVSLTATLASSMVAPTLTTSTATTITTTTALLGATITADGGATITSRGTVWGTTASPTGNVLAEGGTTVAAFTHSRSGFVENTLYTYRGFAVNANGTGYSPDGNFTTIHNTPNVGSGSGATSNSIIANWTAPSSGGSAVFTFEIQVDDDIAFGSPNFTQGSIPSGILSLTAAGLVAATTYYFRVRATNAGGNSEWSVVSVGYATLAAPPNLTASALTGFGNVLINTLSSANSFTISGTNLTTANITLAAVTGYSYATTIGGVYSTTLSLLQTGGSFSQTIFVRFTPNALGAFNGNIVVGGGGSLNTNVAVTGTGVASATSDVSDNTDYALAIPQGNININYINFLDNSNTSTGKMIPMKLKIRDGGATLNDADNLSTLLAGIKFTVQDNSAVNRLSFIKTAILTNQTGTYIATAVKVGAELVFSGMNGNNVTATDNTEKIIHLYVSFDETQVIDNTKLIFSVSNVISDAIGSTFAASNGGGASSDTSNANDRNRIEVVADRLAFLQQPTATTVNVNMSPQPSVETTDLYGRRDLDINIGNISIISSGTLNTTPQNTVVVSGLSTFTTINHLAQGTNLLLTASYSESFTSNVPSSLFDITSIANGSYRTLTAGTWPTSATSTWQRLISGVWTNNAAPPSSTTDLIIIRHTITTSGAFAALGGVGTKVQIENSVTFNAGHNCTFQSIKVENGGVINVTDPAVTILANTGLVTIESGGKLILNSSTLNHIDGFFEGIENFKNGSIVEIQKFDNNSSPGEDDLIETLNPISTNADGYYFGNLFINFTNVNAKAFTLIGVTGNHKLCQNDLTIANQTSTEHIQITNVNANVEIGGNVLVTNNKFTFGSIGSTSIIHTVKGNITVNGSGAIIDLNTTSSASGAVTVNLEGNLIGTQGTIMSTDGGCAFSFSGANLQNININSTVPYNNCSTFIRNNANVQLLNNNLTLNNSSSFTVESGGTFNFNFNGSNVPLLINNGVSGTNLFNSNAGSILKITSLDGLVKTVANSGNIQLSVSNKTFNQTGTFHYIGKSNQVTGDGISTSGTAKTIIAELDTNALQLTLTNSTGITSPGLLNIKKGQVIETTTNYITGSTGGLTMEDGTLYDIPALSTPLTDLIPRLTGISNAYTLNGNSVIKLSGADGSNAFDQILRGARAYRNLTFSNAGVKTVSSSPNSITGNIRVQDAATLNVSDNTMGGSGTNLVMSNTAQYITAGTGTKPDAQGTYSLGASTKISFTNSLLDLQEIKLTATGGLNYANIDIVGTTVGNSSLITGINMLSTGTFTAKDGATFKLFNTAGFTGSIATAINTSTNPTITIEPNSTIDYTGANQTITALSFALNSLTSTTNYSNLKISGTGTKFLPSSEVLVNNNLNITSSILQIDSQKLLTVVNSISTIDDGIDIKNEGNLVQINDVAANSGKIKMERISRPMKLYDYVYWGSPVFEDVIGQMPITFDISFMWTQNGSPIGSWNPTVATMPGRGFITRASVAGSKTYNFRGTPSNGLVQHQTNSNCNCPILQNDELTYTGNTALLANPYPSAIDATRFLNELANDGLGKSIYFWTSHTQFNGTIYQQDDYSSWNILGGVNTYAAPNNPIENLKPKGKIAAGQGFFVQTANDVNVTFKNSMRERTTLDNGQFFKQAQTEAASDTNQKHRVWLNLFNDNNAFRQTLVGYTLAATNNFEIDYDADSFTNNTTDFYSIINNRKLVIQGRGLPFNTNDLVPMGIKISTAGIYTISIDEIDGLFLGNQNIYIQDLLLGTINNLKLSSYSFFTETGIFNDRFILRYTDFTLDNSSFEDINISVLVAVKNQIVTINSILENIEEISIFDVLGRQIYNTTHLNSKKHNIENLNLNKVSLIIKIKLKNGAVLSRKIMM